MFYVVSRPHQSADKPPQDDTTRAIHSHPCIDISMKHSPIRPILRVRWQSLQRTTIPLVLFVPLFGHYIIPCRYRRKRSIISQTPYRQGRHRLYGGHLQVFFFAVRQRRLPLRLTHSQGLGFHAQSVYSSPEPLAPKCVSGPLIGANATTHI